MLIHCSVLLVTSLDIDECDLGIDNCHPNATCLDTDGSFECKCDPGFTGNGTECEGMIFTRISISLHSHIELMVCTKLSKRSATLIIRTSFIQTLDISGLAGDQKIHYHACAEGVANDHLWVWSQVER